MAHHTTIYPNILYLISNCTLVAMYSNSIPILFQGMAACVQQVAAAAITPLSDTANVPAPDCEPIKGIKVLRKDTTGFNVPDLGLTLTHTVSLWIKREISTALDLEGPDEPIKQGHYVIRGEKWPTASADEDGGLGSVGEIVSIQDNNVTVTWSNGKKGKSMLHYYCTNTATATATVIAVLFTALFDDFVVSLQRLHIKWFLFHSLGFVHRHICLQ